MHPDHPGLQQDLGLLLVTTGDLDTAAPLLEQALSRVPTGPAYDGLAAIANRKGNWPQGESFARQAIEAAPILGSAWNNLAIALEEQGKLRAASAAYREAWSRDPSFWQAHFNHGLLLRKQGLFAEARQAFTDVLRRQPHHAGSNYELGLLYAGPLADAPAASRHLKAAIDADPMHPRVTQIRRLLVSLAEYQEQQNK
jgi:tetratricopeptide (TPR) repeat protein